MDNKNGLYGLIAAIAFVITQIVIRSIGIQNISAQIIVTLLLITCIGFFIGTYKNRNKGFGVKYNIIVSILFILASIFTSVMVIILKCYPNLFNKYGLLSTILCVASLFALTLYIIIYKIIYEIKRK